MTPEARVKDKVKKILAAFVPLVYGHWIVQNGMGTPTLDYIGCCCGWYFTIETKAKSRKLTPRQEKTAMLTEMAYGMVFRIIGENDLELLELESWLGQLTMEYEHARR